MLELVGKILRYAKQRLKQLKPVLASGSEVTE